MYQIVKTHIPVSDMKEGKLYVYGGLKEYDILGHDKIGYVIKSDCDQIRIVKGDIIVNPKDRICVRRGNTDGHLYSEIELINKEKQMSVEFSVPYTAETWDAIQALAYANGYKWHGYQDTKYELPCGSSHVRFKGGNNITTGPAVGQVIKFSELARVLDGRIVLKPSIKIGDYTVEFTSSGIKVGCQTVSDETIKAIAKERGLL